MDINAAAIACARANAERNGLADRIVFAHGDLFDGVEGDFDVIIFDPPFRWFEPLDLLEASHTDGGYRTLTRFMEEVPHRLRPGGRIVMNFGTSGDLEYLRELIERSGLVAEQSRYGEATKLGYTAEYFVIRLSRPSPFLRAGVMTHGAPNDRSRPRTSLARRDGHRLVCRPRDQPAPPR